VAPTRKQRARGISIITPSAPTRPSGFTQREQSVISAAERQLRASLTTAERQRVVETFRAEQARGVTPTTQAILEQRGFRTSTPTPTAQRITQRTAAAGPPPPPAPRPPSPLRIARQEGPISMGFAEFAQREARAREKILQREARAREEGLVSPGRVSIGAGITLAGLATARVGVGLGRAIFQPRRTLADILTAVRQPRVTLQQLGMGFKRDPIGTITEIALTGKITGAAIAKIGKTAPLRFAKEEIFIAKQPKGIRLDVRAILKGAKAQEKLKPFPTKELKRVPIEEVAELKPIEARALTKTLIEEKGVVFGSAAARATSKKLTDIPKDIDIAVKNIEKFNKAFVKNLPKAERIKVAIKGEKVVRKATGRRIFDVKPLERLVPQRGLISRVGEIPAVGFTKKLTIKEGSLLPVIKRKVVVGGLTVPTQKFVKVGGIKTISFGEQVTRKGLDASSLKEKHMARWIGKLGHVDALYGINQTSEEKRRGFSRINTLAHRHRDFDPDRECCLLQQLTAGQVHLASKIL
ncbi:hypothetical protein LCGC14_2083440, partial [marine sediment metagenome]